MNNSRSTLSWPETPWRCQIVVGIGALASMSRPIVLRQMDDDKMLGTLTWRDGSILEFCSMIRKITLAQSVEYSV